MKRAFGIGIVLLCATGFALAQTASLDGKTFSRVEGWEYGTDSIFFGADGTFARQIETGDSYVESYGTYTLEAGMYGLRISFDYEKTAAAGASADPGPDSCYYALEPGAGKVLVLYTSEEISGVYVADEDLSLYAAGFTASSELTETLKGKKITYSASSLGDLSLKTFWADGVKGTGIGSRIDVELEPWDGGEPTGMKPAVLIVWNGFPMNPDMFTQNARVKSFDLTVGKAKAARVPLEDTFQPQFVRVNGQAGAASLSLVVTEVYKGSKYEDLCLGKIIVLGAPAK